jgi:MFS family permease
MTADQPVTMGVRDVLRIPDFRRLWVAQSISDIGDGMTLTALLLLVTTLGASTTTLALLSIAIAIPTVIFGLVAGAIADRFDRRRIMLASDLLRAGLVAAFVLVATLERLPILVVLASLQATVGVFFGPARGALVARVVPRHGLLAANSLSQISRIAFGLIGTGVTGVVAGLSGLVWPVFVVDAATFIVSFAIVWGVDRSITKPTGAAHAAAIGMMASLRDGLAIVGRSRALQATIFGAAVVMLGVGAINTLFYPFMIRELGVSPIWSGPVEAAQTASMIMAGALVAPLGRRLGAPRMVTLGLGGTAIVVAALSQVQDVVGLLLVLFAVGWFITPLQAASATIIQSATDDSSRGRVIATFQTAMSTTTILSTALAGVFADQLGIRNVFLLGGATAAVGAVVAGLLFWLDRRARASARSAADPATGVALAASADG